MSKSPNKHNRLWTTAAPLSDSVVDAIETGLIGPFDDQKILARCLADDFGWDFNHARKLWAFGPGDSGANILVDQTQSVQLMNEVKDLIVTGFRWATSQGVLADESMRGVRLNILDATVRIQTLGRPLTRD